jgi:uncharacterized protein (DUF1697 family)
MPPVRCSPPDTLRRPVAAKKTHIALLRGINLARRRRVSMADLHELVTGLGYENVRTHLQSGNVVLTSADAPTTVQRKLERELERSLGMDVQVVVRTRDELAKVIDRDPLGDVVDKPAWYQVTFLSGKPAAKIVRELESWDVAPDQLVVREREIYAWYPSGMQKSRLARMLSDKQLGAVATARNWNTVTKLLAIADEN